MCALPSPSESRYESTWAVSTRVNLQCTMQGKCSEHPDCFQSVYCHQEQLQQWGGRGMTRHMCTPVIQRKVDTSRHGRHGRSPLVERRFHMSTAALAPVTRGSHMLRNTSNSIVVQPYALRTVVKHLIVSGPKVDTSRYESIRVDMGKAGHLRSQRSAAAFLPKLRLPSLSASSRVLRRCRCALTSSSMGVGSTSCR